MYPKLAGHKDYDTTLKYYAKVKDMEAKTDMAESMNEALKIKKYSD